MYLKNVFQITCSCITTTLLQSDYSQYFQYSTMFLLTANISSVVFKIIRENRRQKSGVKVASGGGVQRGLGGFALDFTSVQHLFVICASYAKYLSFGLGFHLVGIISENRLLLLFPALPSASYTTSTFVFLAMGSHGYYIICMRVFCSLKPSLSLPMISFTSPPAGKVESSLTGKRNGLCILQVQVPNGGKRVGSPVTLVMTHPR